MKKVINGALYSTDTAKEQGIWSNNLGGRDFAWCKETLYRTKSGKFFVHGEGGARSRYAERYGNMWGDGEKITPMTQSEAMKWTEENLTADEYAAIFGEPEEASDDLENLNVSIPANVKRKLERLRAETGNSISYIISSAFND